jgi:hypothetical protein
VAAVRSLARRGSRAAAARLLEIASAPEFAARERLEREAVWEALGALAPERTFTTLSDLLLKRRWFARPQDLEDTAIACAGLRRIGTPAAVEVLKRAAALKRGEARALVEKALRLVAQGRGQAARAVDGPGGGGGADGG